MAVTVNEIQRRTGEAINKGIIKTQEYLDHKYPGGSQNITAFDLMKFCNELKNNIRTELTDGSSV